MKDQTVLLDDIVNKTIEHRMNTDAIGLRYYQADNGKCGLELETILGVKTSFFLPHFDPSDIYEYFENQIFDHIFDKLFNENIKDVYDSNRSLIKWIPNSVQDEMKVQLMDFSLYMGIDWKTMYNEIINKLSETGYLSQNIYYYIVAGFFETVASAYFNINLGEVQYSRPDRTGQTKIEFLDGNTITVSKDFFTGYQIYNDLTRAVTIGEFLSDIRAETRRVLCNQNNYT